MSEYSDFENEFEDQEPDETPDKILARLRKELAVGNMEVRPDLAEELMRHAQRAVGEDQFGKANDFVDEAIGLGRQLIDEGEIEYLASVGRCMLFKAAMQRIQHNFEESLNLYNDTIRYLTENLSEDNPIGRNELAVALMNKADLLLDPIGAQSAAIAAQQQAVLIWRRLLEFDELNEFRIQYASGLLSLGDTKLETGDGDSALADYQKAAETIRDGIATEESGLDGLLIQVLLKLSKLYDKRGDIPAAFECSTEAIQLLEQAVEDGNDMAEPALAALYLQQGMLYERIDDSASALVAFDRCCDIYRKMVDKRLSSPGDYFARTGLANTLMCRANMLADLKRYDEAEESFRTSIDCYRQAADSQPEDDKDETFIPYSIGVVQLNHANMLVAENRLDEAIRIKDEAISALKNRYEAGHREILPNIVSAYRKLIGIRRMRNEKEGVFDSLKDILDILESTVDEGDLEYRSDLAVMYHLRAVCHEEQNDSDLAEKDLFRSLRIFRELADDETDSAETQWAKLQWGENLQQIAVFYVRHDRVDDAWRLFQREINDLFPLLAEDNEQILFDILFGQSQFVEFAASFLREEYKEFSREDLHRWTQIALDTTQSGIDLVRRYRPVSSDNVSLNMFFRMKTAFFRRHEAMFLAGVNEIEKAQKTFEEAISEWKSLVDDTEKLRFEKEYYQTESERQAEEDKDEKNDLDGIADGYSGNIRVPHLPPLKKESDALSEKWLYYISELRQTLQNAALFHLTNGNQKRAEELFQRNIEISRDLMRRKLPDTDQSLIVSLMTFGRALETTEDKARAIPLYEEASQLIQKRIEHGPAIPPDFGMFKHVFVTYATLLDKTEQHEKARNLTDVYCNVLEHLKSYPDPEIWLDLCQALNVSLLWQEDKQQIRKRKLALLAQHPGFDDKEKFDEYEKRVEEKYPLSDSSKIQDE